MTAADHILVVDDHPDIRSSLAAYLRRQGLAVTTAADAAQAGALLRQERFDLIVLDVMMPGEDGLSLCRRVSGTLDTPVILLTAMHTSADKVAGLDSGADDYVVKPFDPPELVARIRMVLRRWRRTAASVGNAATGYAFGGWFLDTGKRELFDPDGQPAALSSAEYRLLRVLAEHPGTVLSRDRLMDLTGCGDALAFDRSIDSQVSRLRKKLEPDPRRPSLLKTVWGNGYLFAATVTARPALAAS
ncbi:response regulator [Pseudoduganella umbonata]|uniref:Response regulator transcription factor n=1 Tax=Pseudoduganella umbonata TaxID=864828 RepID=A0A4V1EDT5_9BURK|nr:response regulator transcription factor [Pseudoduganella umbonata]MBB3220256.1 two-component system OmpR family response regulator [Pseudoduganella umbonata]QCP12201.1 response regulator transcription factor [Pseudoduganella umbonata]